jgi:hypothetical protein
MRARVRLPLLLSLAALPAGALVASSSAARHSGAKASCPLGRTAPLVAADARALLFSRSEGHEIFGCAFGHSRTTYLGQRYECGNGESGCGGVQQETLAGPLAAYESEHDPGGIPHRVVVVRSLSSGRVIRKLPTGTPHGPEEVGGGPTTAIVVKDDGAVAWIVETSGLPEEYEVRAADRSGSRLLARGQDISPGSLALAGSTLYWTQGNKPFSSPLN